MSSIISPPVFKTKKYTVTPADLLGAVVLVVKKFTAITGNAVSDAIFDGSFNLQMQKQDGTWGTAGTIINGPNQKRSILGSSLGGATNILGANLGDDMFPFNVRVIIDTVATLGAATIIIRYL